MVCLKLYIEIFFYFNLLKKSSSNIDLIFKSTCSKSKLLIDWIKLNFYITDVDTVRQLAARFLSGKIKTKFENFKKVMKTGKAAYNIPILDPFNYDNYSLLVNKTSNR